MHRSVRAYISGGRIGWIAGIVLYLFAQLAGAGVNVLTALGPEGGSVWDIEYHPSDPSVVFATTASGLHRSKDGGVSWEHVSYTAGFGDIAIHPVTHRLFVVDRELLVSDDGGTTLKPAENFPAGLANGRRIEISVDGSTVYVAGEVGFFQSRDQGASWRERLLPGDRTMDSVRALAVDPDDADVLYLLRGNEYLFVSHDGGSTWTNIELPKEFNSASTLVYDIAIAKTAPKHLWIAGSPRSWRTADEGQTWTPNSFFSSAATIAVDPRDPSNIYISESERILHSISGGNAFERVTAGARAGAIAVIAPSPFQPSRLLVGGGEGLALSTDGGKTWTQPNAGIVATDVNDLVPVAGSNRTYVASSNGMYELEGGSLTLAPLNNEGLRDSSGGRVSVSNLFARTQPEQLFALVSTGIVVRSDDRGQSWVQDPSWPHFVNFVAGSASDPQSMLVSASSDVYWTVNGGNAWAISTGLPPNSVKRGLAIAPSNPAVSYVALGKTTGQITDGYGVYRSLDSGQTWQPVNTGIETAHVAAVAVDPRDERVVYAGTFSGFMKSTDGGNSWREIDWNSNSFYSEAYTIAIDPVHPDIVFAGQVLGRVARSVDRGETWQTVLEQPVDSAYLFESMALDPSDPSRVLLGTLGHGLHEIRIQPDLSIAADKASQTMTENVAATVTFTIANHGPFDATGVTSTIALGASAQSVTAQSAEGSCIANEGTITCKHAILRTGATKTIQVTFAYSASGERKLDASVTGDQPDFSSVNNTAATTITVSAPSTPANGGASGGGGSGGGGGGGSSSPAFLFLLGLIAAIVRTSRAQVPFVRVRSHFCEGRNQVR